MTSDNVGQCCSQKNYTRNFEFYPKFPKVGGDRFKNKTYSFQHFTNLSSFSFRENKKCNISIKNHNPRLKSDEIDIFGSLSAKISILTENFLRVMINFE